VIVSTAAQEETYASTIALAQELGIAPQEAAQRVQACLMDVAQFILTLEPGAFVVTGGETAANLAQTFGIHQLNVLDAIEPAIPFCQSNTIAFLKHAVPCSKKLFLVTKSGSFGTEASLWNIYRYLRKRLVPFS
jgi:uncharacterized protein YgbK (DUF1537 family)